MRDYRRVVNAGGQHHFLLFPISERRCTQKVDTTAASQLRQSLAFGRDSNANTRSTVVHDRDVIALVWGEDER